MSRWRAGFPGGILLESSVSSAVLDMHVAATVTDAEEDAADCLINALRWRRVIVVDDANWRRVTRMRR